MYRNLYRGWPFLLPLLSEMPVFALELKVTRRNLVGTPGSNPGFLLLGSRRKHSPHSKGHGLAGVGRGGAGCKGWAWAGLVPVAGAGAGGRWLVQVPVAGAGGWCRWLL